MNYLFQQFIIQKLNFMEFKMKPHKKKNTTIENSKFKYGIFKLNDTVQLPPNFGNSILLKNQIASILFFHFHNMSMKNF